MAKVLRQIVPHMACSMSVVDHFVHDKNKEISEVQPHVQSFQNFFSSLLQLGVKPKELED